MSPRPGLDQIADRLARAQHVLALTGAGISAESGLPTFREAQTGHWARYRPEDLATREGFARDPAMVWRWYAMRHRLACEAEPNAGHRALAALAGLVPAMVLATQNVDGLHRRAGSAPLELHGSLERVRCFQEQRHADRGVRPWPQPDAGVPPSCACGAWLRPDVVWFGEALPEAVLLQAIAAAESAEVVLVVGTSGLVYPAAELPLAALQAGAFVVEVNPEPTPLTERAQAWLRGPAAAMLPALVAAVAARQRGAVQ